MRLRRRSVYPRERHRRAQRLAVRGSVVPKQQSISEQTRYAFQAVRAPLKLAEAQEDTLRGRGRRNGPRDPTNLHAWPQRSLLRSRRALLPRSEWVPIEFPSPSRRLGSIRLERNGTELVLDQPPALAVPPRRCFDVEHVLELLRNTEDHETCEHEVG